MTRTRVRGRVAYDHLTKRMTPKRPNRVKLYVQIAVANLESAITSAVDSYANAVESAALGYLAAESNAWNAYVANEASAWSEYRLELADIPIEQQRQITEAIAQYGIDIAAANSRYATNESNAWGNYVGSLAQGESAQERFATPPNMGGMPAVAMIAHTDPGSRLQGPAAPAPAPERVSFWERVGHAVAGGLAGGVAGGVTGGGTGAVVGGVVAGPPGILPGAVGGAAAGGIAGSIRGVFADSTREAIIAGGTDGALAGPFGGAVVALVKARKVVQVINAAVVAHRAAGKVVNAQSVVAKAEAILAKQPNGPYAGQARAEIAAARQVIAKGGHD